jgi:hypothetical protein
MTTLIPIFASSLFLLALFFAFKEWEMKRETTTAFTRFLQKHSPVAHEHFVRTRTRVIALVLSVLRGTRDLVLYVLHQLLTWGRTAVVVIAAHMIRAARGEKLVAQGKVSSEYFKHLHNHKKKIQGGISDEKPVE